MNASGGGYVAWQRKEGNPISLYLAPSKFAKPAFLERTPEPCTCLGQQGNCRLEQAVLLVVWFGRLCLRVGQMQMKVSTSFFFFLPLTAMYFGEGYGESGLR